jgi:hypothetical protein
MKKNAKIRLTLNRETLRNLSPDQVRTAEGGIVLQTGATCICPVPVQVTQQSCPTHCGQWYCYGV